MEDSPVDLGFLEPTEGWLLSNRYFRSKVGGKPAWLEVKHLPSPEELMCDSCQRPCIFLCQVYAPLVEQDACFHRVLYVFVCLSASCNGADAKGTIKALRSQLPRQNDYYDYEPPDETVRKDPIKTAVTLCTVCGCRGTKTCSRCRRVNYCGEIHQRMDWKGGHKLLCSATEPPSSVAGTDNTVNLLLPQFEIVTEPEELEEELKLTEEENLEQQMKEYERLKSEGKVGEMSELPEAELDKYSSEEVEDRTFSKFKQRIANDPDQILRYERNGKPLWISGDDLPETIPDCETCGSRRVFEFQIMPQLLNSLKSESLDWGVLAIYSCEQSCATESYAKEFVFRQGIRSADNNSLHTAT